jgi:iron complex transport system ATP-binding protein
MSLLAADQLTVGFTGQTVLQKLSLVVEPGKILSIIGPNGSGKSTLLKTLSRNIKPQEGLVLLDGRDIHQCNAKKLARQLAMLPQGSSVPDGLTVRDLVAYGRFPYQSWWRQSDETENREIVEWALAKTGLAALASRTVHTLSGGERQRVWIAMALAQKPRILLLDEPTTYLDLCYQLEILDLIRQLNQEQQMTIVMVLHDINYAARYADVVAVLAQGTLYAVGRPDAVITTKMLREVFQVEADLWRDGAGKIVCLAQRLADPKNNSGKE